MALEEVKYAGRLSSFYSKWQKITDDAQVLSWIQGNKITFSEPVVWTTLPSVPKNIVLSSNEQLRMTEAINKLISIGAVSKCVPCKGQFISSYFLVPKPNGKDRFVLNLKKLNKFIDTAHFKIEDLRTALKLISQGCYMSTIDLKDAYFLVKMHPESKKYLRFIYNNELFEFNVLAFGLCTAPFVFTKIMKPVIKLLRCRGHLSTVYLDDYFLIGLGYETCMDNIFDTSRLLEALGFIINKEKSNLQPKNSCKFLGFIIDSIKLRIYLPEEKVIKIKNELLKFQSLKCCRIRDFAHLVGLLNSACNAIEYGRLYTKELERVKYLNLLNDDNYEKYMNLPDSISSDLKWWYEAVIRNRGSKIKTDCYCLEIFSDASTTGWGAACGSDKASGLWSIREQQNHINYLEILAAFLGLRTFAKDKRNCDILLRIDNTTAISYINRMGGVQFPHLTRVTKDLWQWCESRAIHVFASYIRSADNCVADAESRRVHPDIEWELADYAFQDIVLRFGQPEIDLFASRINKKCAKYVSWHKDPDAYAINAFTISWSDYFFYAFPPFSIILKTIRKIIAEKASGILVVPLWPTQPWFPLFNSLIVGQKMVLSQNENLILSHSSNRLVHQQTTLVAALLSARHY